MSEWRCSRCGATDAKYTEGCSGCGVRRLVLYERRDREQGPHDVTSGPCKCGAWH